MCTTLFSMDWFQEQFGSRTAPSKIAVKPSRIAPISNIKNIAIKHVGVSENEGTPKSSILVGFSNIYHPFSFWGIPMYGNPHVILAFFVVSPQVRNVIPHCFFRTSHPHFSPHFSSHQNFQVNYNISLTSLFQAIIYGDNSPSQPSSRGFGGVSVVIKFTRIHSYSNLIPIVAIDIYNP